MPASGASAGPTPSEARLGCSDDIGHRPRFQLTQISPTVARGTPNKFSSLMNLTYLGIARSLNWHVCVRLRSGGRLKILNGRGCKHGCCCESVLRARERAGSNSTFSGVKLLKGQRVLNDVASFARLAFEGQRPLQLAEQRALSALIRSIRFQHHSVA